ncbi:MAG TPA: hypothetical protein VF731_00845 [Solirubrobacterales bacterium]
MATLIHFVGRDQLMVRESEEEVRAAFERGAGLPLALTHQRTGNRVFVNPGQVTYWQARAATRADSYRAGMARIPSLS